MQSSLLILIFLIEARGAPPAGAFDQTAATADPTVLEPSGPDIITAIDHCLSPLFSSRLREIGAIDT
jgi:hypothetical protein